MPIITFTMLRNQCLQWNIYRAVLRKNQPSVSESLLRSCFRNRVTTQQSIYDMITINNCQSIFIPTLIITVKLWWIENALDECYHFYTAIEQIRGGGFHLYVNKTILHSTMWSTAPVWSIYCSNQLTFALSLLEHA